MIPSAVNKINKLFSRADLGRPNSGFLHESWDWLWNSQLLYDFWCDYVNKRVWPTEVFYFMSPVNKTRKSYFLESCPVYDQKKNFHIWKNVVSVPKNSMVFHIKQVIHIWNRLETAFCYYEKPFLRDHSLQQQVHFSATNTPEQSLVKFIPNTWRLVKKWSRNPTLFQSSNSDFFKKVFHWNRASWKGSKKSTFVVLWSKNGQIVIFREKTFSCKLFC